jgi:drug/metabolite transporter (DMT)-like permease
MSGLSLPLLLAFVSSFCFGTSKVLVRKAGNVNQFVGVLYTLAVAPPILACFAVINGDAFRTYNYSLWTIANLALSGAIFLVLGRVFAYTSISIIGASRSSQLTGTQVIFAAVLSVVFLREQITVVLAVGTVTIFLGELLISFSNPSGSHAIPARLFRKGVLIGLAGGFFWGSGQLFAMVGARALGSSTMGSLTSYLFAITVQLMLVFSSGSRSFVLRRKEALFMLASGTVSALAVLSQYTALLVAPVVSVSPIVNTSPLITLIVSQLVMSQIEQVNRKVLLGAILVVFGAILVAAF